MVVSWMVRLLQWQDSEPAQTHTLWGQGEPSDGKEVHAGLLPCCLFTIREVASLRSGLLEIDSEIEIYLQEFYWDVSKESAPVGHRGKQGLGRERSWRAMQLQQRPLQIPQGALEQGSLHGCAETRSPGLCTPTLTTILTSHWTQAAPAKWRNLGKATPFNCSVNPCTSVGHPYSVSQLWPVSSQHPCLWRNESLDRKGEIGREVQCSLGEQLRVVFQWSLLHVETENKGKGGSPK